MPSTRLRTRMPFSVSATRRRLPALGSLAAVAVAATLTAGGGMPTGSAPGIATGPVPGSASAVLSPSDDLTLASQPAYANVAFITHATSARAPSHQVAVQRPTGHLTSWDKTAVRRRTTGLRRLRSCESGGNYRAATGNGYYGAYQFDVPTWRGLGLSGLPSNASSQLQDTAVVRLAAHKGWGPWPVCSYVAGLR